MQSVLAQHVERNGRTLVPGAPRFLKRLKTFELAQRFVIKNNVTFKEIDEICLGCGLIEGRDGDRAMESPDETL